MRSRQSIGWRRSTRRVNKPREVLILRVRFSQCRTLPWRRTGTYLPRRHHQRRAHTISRNRRRRLIRTRPRQNPLLLTTRDWVPLYTRLDSLFLKVMFPWVLLDLSLLAPLWGIYGRTP